MTKRPGKNKTHNTMNIHNAMNNNHRINFHQNRSFLQAVILEFEMPDFQPIPIHDLRLSAFHQVLKMVMLRNKGVKAHREYLMN